MTHTPFEALMQKQLEAWNSNRVQDFMGAYHKTLTYLSEHIYEEIKSSEPHLTDHGRRHIENVQQNVVKLLPVPGKELESLTALEMYCLGMSILFHDAGNINTRTGHERNIGEIFDAARGTESRTRREKTLVLRTCAAHTGKSSVGSLDTLKDLAEEDQFEGESVRLRQLGAILRFADELAEGPQRTSDYRRIHNQYDANSRVYHDYASITHIHVDRGHERIAIVYEISVDKPPDNETQSEWLENLMTHILHRIIKLDQERRYARYYAPLLSPFKATQVSFNFHCGNELMDVNIEPIRLDDCTIPGTASLSLEEQFPEIALSTFVTKLIEDCPALTESRK